MPAVSPVPPSPAADAELIAACRRSERGAWEFFDVPAARVIYTVPRRAGLGDEIGTDRSPALRVRLFERTYGSEFDATTKARIIAHLRGTTDAAPDRQCMPEPAESCLASSPTTALASPKSIQVRSPK